jgi:hypothetical protein
MSSFPIFAERGSVDQVEEGKDLFRNSIEIGEAVHYSRSRKAD